MYLTYVLLYAELGFTQQTISVDVKKRVKKINGKNTYSAWQPYETRIVNLLPDFEPQEKIELNRYGFSKTITGTSTGFYHTEKINGRWWVIDPDGHAGFNIVMSDTKPGTSKRNEAAFAIKYGNKIKWMSETAKLLLDLGFNGVGAWSDVESVREYNKTAVRPLAYTECLYWLLRYAQTHDRPYRRTLRNPKNSPPVFDIEFEAYCMKRAKELASHSNDPNIFGYFTDNEIPFEKNNLDGYLDFPEDDAGYQAATKFLAEKGITREQIKDEHRMEFLSLVVEKYFSVVTKAFRTYDQNHMYLGIRLHGSPKITAAVLESCARHTDILTINYYGQWGIAPSHYAKWKKYAPDMPFQITEFYTKSMDSGFPNTDGAGWIVRTQADRGNAYQHYCLSMLQYPECVGWHYFKYQDNDPNNLKGGYSNIDANKGIVDNDYKPYLEFTTRIKQLNINYLNLIEYFRNHPVVE